jgi:outer membrane protein assembly factor BamB
MIRSISTLAILIFTLGACASRDLHPEFKSEEVLRRKWTYSIEPLSSSLSGSAIEYVSPVLHENTLIFGSSRFGLISLYPRIQRAKWQLAIPNGVVSQIEVKKDQAYFTGGDGNVYAISLDTGKVDWSYALRNPVTSRPVVSGEDLFVVTSDDAILSLEAKTGKWQWHYRRRNTSGPGIHGASRPLVMGDTLWVGFADGALVALSRKEGKVLWEKQLNSNKRFSNLNAEFVEQGGLVYVPAYDNALYALNSKSGSPTWVRDDVGGSQKVTVSQGVVYAPSSNGYVYALDAKTGRDQWKFELDQGVPSEVVVTDQHVIFSSSDEYLYALDRKSGRMIYRFHMGYASGFSGGLAFDPVKKQLYALSRGGNLLNFQYLAR